MILTADNLNKLCETAISAATRAGQLIAEYADKKVKIDTKAGKDTLAGQVVTEVDHLSQDVILKSLAPTCKTYDLAVLTEESTDSGERLEKDYFWCIDPMDGTLSFINSTPGYAVSIALVARDGTPYIGVVYDPVEQILYHAVKDHGAFKNNAPWQPAATPGQPLTLTFDHSFTQHPQFNDLLKGLEKIALELNCSGTNIMKSGGAVMNAIRALDNAPGCFLKFPKPKGGSLWDYAAIACIYHEIGAPASDIHGRPLDLNRPDSTYMNHHGILFAGDKPLAAKCMKLYKELSICK